MKESRFIELLNLYVDHQLTAAEAAELEREIQQNAKHRRTYQQYCRMQKACTQLFEKERVNAPASPRLAKALAEADRKVVGGAPVRTPSFWSPGLIGTGFAAAAAMALVIFVQRPQRPQVSSPAVAATPTPTQPVAEAVVPVAAPREQKSEAQYALYPLRIQKSEEVLAQRKQSGVSAASGFASTQGVEVFDWMQAVDLRPIQPVPEDRFALQPVQRQTLQPFSGAPAHVTPAQPGDEVIGFQFKR